VAEAADSDRQQAALVVAADSGPAATVDDPAVTADSGQVATADDRAVMADSDPVATAVDPAVMADSGQVATAVDPAVMAGSDRVATTVLGPEATTALGQAAITALGPVVITVSGQAAITASGPVVITVSGQAAITASGPVATTASDPVATTASDPVVTTASGPVAITASGPVAIIIDLMAIERTTRSTTTGFLVKSIFHASATTILLSTTGVTSSRFRMPTFRTAVRLSAGISMATIMAVAGTATTLILGGVERVSGRVCGLALLGAVSYHFAVLARFPCTTTTEHLLSTLPTA
jgi:hypothetical protein